MEEKDLQCGDGGGGGGGGQWSGPFISGAVAPGCWFPSTTFLLTSGPSTHH